MTATSVNGQPAPAPTDELMLSLSDITVRFGGITALDRLSFDARAGEVLGIIGPNGAGKTTLFDVIAGVRPPNEGQVLLAGRDITSTSSTSRARTGLRRTFQRVQAFGWLTVEDNVLAALEWRGGGGGFIADLAYFQKTMLIASAHNLPVESFPWRFASVLSVGSHDRAEPLDFFYNPEPPVEFFARGVDIDVAWLQGSSLRCTGNSFATPHMTGICALVLGSHPELTPFQLKSVLYLTATNMIGSQ